MPDFDRLANALRTAAFFETHQYPNLAETIRLAASEIAEEQK